MKKTNFTFLKGFAMSALMVFGFANANAQGLACQDHINASLDVDCKVDLATIVSAAGASTIAVKNGSTALTTGTAATYGTAAGLGSVVIGNIYTYELTGAAGNKCWGTIKFEDKLAPSMTCPAPTTVSCSGDYKFSTSEVLIGNQGGLNAAGLALTTGTPSAIKECSNYNLYYSDAKTLACLATSVGTVTRTFRITDQYGNTFTCTQLLTIVGGGTSVVTFALPADITVTACAKDFAIANYTPSAMAVNTGSGIIAGLPGTIASVAYPAGLGGAANDCMISGTYTDKITADACGNKIVRTWVLVNMCNGTVLTATTLPKISQLITITDNQAPIFAAATLADMTISTGAADCLSSQEVPFPSVSDNCCIASATVAINGINFSAAITACKPGAVTIKGIPTGIYTATWKAVDACGNTTTKTQLITVKDLVPPVAVADQNTNVSLTLDCTATVNATTFDDGSLDNCCLDVNKFEVARMDGGVVGEYKSTITFVKGDLSKAEGTNNPSNLLAGCRGSVMIAFRVWDCNGNSNVAMVNVVVEDKIGPQAQAKDTMVMCGNTALGTQWLESWEKRFSFLTLLQYPPVAGTNPGYFDNCDATVTWDAITGSIDQCSNGTISRKVTVKDKCDRSASATFNYNSGHQANFEVTLPKNNKYTCPGSTVPTKADAIAAARASIKTISGCPVVAVDIKSEEIFSAVAGACYRIKRTWVVSSLCHNGMRRGDTKFEDGIMMGNSLTDYIYKSRTDGANEEGKLNPDDDKYVEYVQVIDVNDSQKPEITNPQTPTLVAEGKCGLKLTVGGFDATDACAPVVAKTWSLLDANKAPVVAGTPAVAVGGSSFPASHTFSTADYGKKFYVRYRAEDKCGNIDVRDYLVEPKDIIKPTPVCYQGLSVDLMPTTGEVWLSADMFDAGSSDGCGVDVRPLALLPAVSNPAPVNNTRQFGDNYSVELRIEKGTPAFGTGIPATNMIWVGCVGIVPIRIWAIDAAGNADYCDTYVDVQNNMGATPKEGNCKPVVLVGTKVAGAITTSNGKALENTLVTVEASTAANPFKANVATGSYSTLVGTGSNVKVTAEKNDNPLNGVSTFDLVLISKHILGTQTISDKYAQIAADVNNSGKVTTSDVVELRKMILGIQSNFNNNKSWRFFDATMNEEVKINNIAADTKINFTAVKVGDINGNANAASAPRTAATHEFTTADQALVAGQTTELVLNGTEGFGFTMNYDVKSLEVVSVDANSAVIENGTITTAQVGSEFKVTFKAIANVTLSNAIAINSNVTAAEAVVNGEVANVALKFNNKVSGFELFQNQPNPFRGATTISFNASATGNYTVTITDLAGRTVSTSNGNAVKGMNNVSVELNNAGVYNYTVTTGNFTATKKMVVIE